MLDDWLRSLKDRLFEPIAPSIGRWVHPNVITLLSFLAGLAAALMAARGRTVESFLAWVVCRTLDGLDGSVARASGTQSDFGGYLDIVADFVVYAAVPLGILLGHPSDAAWRSGLFLFATFYVNTASLMYLAAILERRNRGAATTGERTTITMPPGIVAGTETVILYSVLLLVPAWAPVIFWSLGGLVLVNVPMRLIWARNRI